MHKYNIFKEKNVYNQLVKVKKKLSELSKDNEMII